MSSRWQGVAWMEGVNHLLETLILDHGYWPHVIDYHVEDAFCQDLSHLRGKCASSHDNLIHTPLLGTGRGTT